MADEEQNATVKSDVRVSFEDAIAALRNDLLQTDRQILSLKAHEFLGGEKIQPTPGVDAGEVIANIMLAKRHAEDARMRLGKVFQALDGGKSPLAR